MTPAEHYAKAEELAAKAKDRERSPETVDRLIALAQVHASLANATEAAKHQPNSAYPERP